MEIKLKKKNTPKEEGCYLCLHPLYSNPEFVDVRLENGKLVYVSRSSTYPMKDCRKDFMWSDKFIVTECY